MGSGLVRLRRRDSVLEPTSTQHPGKSTSASREEAWKPLPPPDPPQAPPVEARTVEATTLALWKDDLPEVAAARYLGLSLAETKAAASLTRATKEGRPESAGRPTRKPEDLDPRWLVQAQSSARNGDWFEAVNSLTRALTDDLDSGTEIADTSPSKGLSIDSSISSSLETWIPASMPELLRPTPPGTPTSAGHPEPPVMPLGVVKWPVKGDGKPVLALEDVPAVSFANGCRAIALVAASKPMEQRSSCSGQLRNLCGFCSSCLGPRRSKSAIGPQPPPEPEWLTGGSARMPRAGTASMKFALRSADIAEAKLLKKPTSRGATNPSLAKTAEF